MIVYIAGPMNGRPGSNHEGFDRAAQCWHQAGHKVLNPAAITRASWGVKSKKEIIRADLDCVMMADAVALLPGWERSPGATVEVSLAVFLGLRLFDAIAMRQVEVDELPWEVLRGQHEIKENQRRKRCPE